nr:odorant receptor [Semanotus bifasciatus]
MRLFNNENAVPFSATMSILYYSLAHSNGKSESKLIVMFGWILRLLGFINLGVFTCHHLVTSVRDGIHVDISEDISCMVGGTVAIIMVSLFKYWERKWSKLMADVVDFSKFGQPPEFHEFSKRMNMLSKVSFAGFNLAGFTYIIVAYNATSYCKGLNEEMGLHEFCGYYTSIRLPFEGNSLMVRLPIFLTQVVVSNTSLMAAAHLTFVMYEITEYLILHIKQLKQNLVEVFDAESSQECSDRLKFCVIYHLHILKLIERLSSISKFTIGDLSLTAAIVFGCIGNQIVKVKSAASVAYFVAYVAALFYICHSGQRVADETHSLGYALYESKWHEADAKIMRDVVLVLCRCRKPGTLEALPLGDLNYPLFLMIMKSAYTYLTLLTQTT